MRNALLSLVVGSLAVVTAASALAQEKNPWEIGFVVGSSVWQTADRAFDLFDDNDWATLGRVGVEVEIVDDWFLMPAFTFGSQSSELFGSMETKLKLTSFELTARKGFQVFSWWRPYASLSGTLTWTRASIADTVTFESKEGFLEASVGGKGAIGFEFMLPRGVFGRNSERKGLFKDFTASVAVEGGYRLEQGHDLSAMSFSTTHLSDGGTPEAAPLEVGTLNLSGGFVNIDFRVIF